MICMPPGAAYCSMRGRFGGQAHFSSLHLHLFERSLAIGLVYASGTVRLT